MNERLELELEPGHAAMINAQTVFDCSSSQVAGRLIWLPAKANAPSPSWFRLPPGLSVVVWLFGFSPAAADRAGSNSRQGLAERLAGCLPGRLPNAALDGRDRVQADQVWPVCFQMARLGIMATIDLIVSALVRSG